MPDKKKRGRPKKENQVIVDTNVRVTKETHLRMKTLADLWGLTMSEAVNLLIRENVPEVEQAIQLRAQMKKKAGKNKPEVSEQN